MLNELVANYFYGKCPVCGRLYISAFERFVTWCPYCGTPTLTDNSSTNGRLTERDDQGIARYVGNLSHHKPEYAHQLTRNAVEEILEKLCVYEENEAAENETEEDG